MLLGHVFERFVQESPVSVMVRGLLEKFLCPQKLDELFEQSAFVSVHSGTLILNGGRFDGLCCKNWMWSGKSSICAYSLKPAIPRL